MIARDLREHLHVVAVADSDFSHKLCGAKYRHYRSLHHT